MNPIIPKTNSAPGAGAPASLYLGELASNRTTGKLYLGCDAGVVEIQGGGGTSGSQISTFAGTGSATVFAPLNGYNGTDAGGYIVSVGGIDQRPTTDWTISSANSGTITFASAPPNGAAIVVRAFVGASGGSGGSGDATSLQGRPLADTAPTNGQAVVWDEAGNTWNPGTVDRFTRGEWNDSTTYAVGDVVSYQSQLYVCILENQGAPISVYGINFCWRLINGNAVLFQSRPVSDVAPADGNVMVWNSSYTRWEPQSQQQGPEGPQGDPGPQGAPGTDGTDGKDGTTSYKGAWNGNDDYEKDNLVTYNAALYVALVGGHGNTPSESSGQWAVLANHNATKLQGIDVTSSPPENEHVLLYSAPNNSLIFGVINATQLQNYAVSSSPPSNKQVLVFDQFSNSWGSTIDPVGKINEIITFVNSIGASILPL